MRVTNLFIVSALLTVATAGRDAHAHLTFPGIVQSTLGLNYTPACTICHNNPAGGLGTATEPFALYLKSRGLVDPNEGSLRSALAAAEVETQGMTYVALLKADQNPNGNSNLAPPDYGCGAHVAPRTGSNAGAPWLLAGFAVGAALRRRVRQSAAARRLSLSQR